MASITINTSDWTADGTTLSVYKRSAWGVEGISGSPSGSAVTTGVAAAGAVTFNGLADNEQYVAFDSGSGRWRRFSTPGAVAGGLTDQSVLPRHAQDLLRTGGWVPTGAIDQTIPDRLSAGATNQTLVSGTLYLCGGIVVPGGRTVSNISFMSGSTALAGGTNQWFCLVDAASRAVLATTIDDTTNAWGTNTVKTLALATAIGGSTPGGTWTPANGLEVYIGICVAATTPPNIKGAAGNAALAGVAPVQTGTSSTGLTGPASLSSPVPALTSIVNLLYGWVS